MIEILENGYELNNFYFQVYKKIMGNEQTKKHNDIEIELNHSRINTIKVINDPKKRYMQALFGVQFPDYDLWKNNLQKAKLSSEYLLLPNKHQFATKALCGTSGSVKVDYDNYPYLLIQEIENRRGKKKRFDQTELWLLLYCLLDAQKQMRNGNSSKLGDVRPQNVFLNEQGSIKIANVLSWPRQTSNYQKFHQHQITYLAPEDVNLIHQSFIDNDANKLSQIFSIGLTVLSASTLVDFKYLYNVKSSTFNLQEFNRVVNEWRLNENYSDIFKATLCSLIEVDQEYRLSELELQPWIQQYKNQILSRNNFVITSPPKKVIQQVQLIRSMYEQIHQYSHSGGLSSIHGSQQKRVFTGLPLQGQRRLIQQKRLPPVSTIPGTSTTQSVYTPVQRSFLPNYLLQGAPITSNNPVYVNRISQNPVVLQSTYIKSWSYQQGNASIPKMNFEYSSSPQRSGVQADAYIQSTPQRNNIQQVNHVQTTEDNTPQQQRQSQN